MEVAAAQIPVSWDIDQNLMVIAEAVREAEGADLLVLPEGAISGYDPELSGLDQLAPETVDRAIQSVVALVERHALNLFCGSLIYSAGAWRNAGLYVSPQGVEGIYHKVNLATRERGRLQAGDQLPVFSLALPGQAVVLGCQICRELRFPDQWHVLARAGVQLVAYLTHAADRDAPKDVWRSHLISRAAETQRFIVAVNVADRHQHCPTAIVSPRGEVIASARHTAPDQIRASIDLGTVADWYLNQQRDDVVHIEYTEGEPRPASGSDQT